MPIFKAIALSIAGFVIPALLVVAFAPVLFEHTGSAPVFQRARLAGETTDNDSSMSEEDSISDAGPGSGALSIPSDETLDSAPGKGFLVSLNLTIEGMPKYGKRAKLVTKYLSNQSPYPGWAIAVRRLKTSFRPEFYLQDSEGNGGWFSFQHVELKESIPYTLNFLVLPGRSVSAYLQTVAVEGSETEPGDPVYLGGFPIKTAEDLRTDSPLQITSGRSKATDFRGEISGVLLAHLSTISAKRSYVNELLSGGPAEIAERLETEAVSLLIDEAGQDKSRFQRTLTRQIKGA